LAAFGAGFGAAFGAGFLAAGFGWAGAGPVVFFLRAGALATAFFLLNSLISAARARF